MKYYTNMTCICLQFYKKHSELITVTNLMINSNNIYNLVLVYNLMFINIFFLNLDDENKIFY